MPIVGLRRHGLDQRAVQLGQLRFERLDRLLDVLQHEAMPGREFPFQGQFQVRLLFTEGALGQLRQFLDRDPGDQPVADRMGGDAVTIRDHGTQFDTGVVEHLVQAIFSLARVWASVGR